MARQSGNKLSFAWSVSNGGYDQLDCHRTPFTASFQWLFRRLWAIVKSRSYIEELVHEKAHEFHARCNPCLAEDVRSVRFDSAFGGGPRRCNLGNAQSLQHVHCDITLCRRQTPVVKLSSCENVHFAAQETQGLGLLSVARLQPAQLSDKD